MVDALRLILLGIGLLIIGLIYAWGMRAQIRDRLKTRRQEPGLDSPEVEEPTVDASDADVWSRSEVRVRPASSAESSHAKPAAPKSTQPKTLPPQPTASKPTQPKTLPSQPTDPKPAPTTTRTLPEQAAGSGEPKPSAAAPRPTQPRPKPPETKATPKPSQPSPSHRVRQPAAAPPSTPKPAPAKTRVWNVLLTLIAPERQPYTGKALQAAFEQQNFVLAERGVWECLTGDGSDQMIFGIAHLREPGTFDPAQLDRLRTPGLLLFMPLPGPLSAATAVDLMIEEAGQLQRRLGGAVCDERRHRLTPQSLLQLRVRADEFDRKTQ